MRGEKGRASAILGAMPDEPDLREARLVGLDGTPLPLADLRGRATLLIFLRHLA